MTDPKVGLMTIAREWGRIGCIGFGGPPAHITLLRALCVERKGWLSATDFEDGIAATNLLPGPASTQLAILCAWRLRGPAGAIVGGVCFIVPGLILILALAIVFLAAHPPYWVMGAAAGAGAAVPAVAANAAAGLIPASLQRTRGSRAGRIRWACYLVAGGVAAAVIGPWLVAVLAVCGLLEVAIVAERRRAMVLSVVGMHGAASGGLLAVMWVAFKVGALSYGGGFVIIPLMQHETVHTYHWMSGTQFLDAVALGQITPGPVVQTVAVVGYAAAGIGGGLLAALFAFTPSFVFVLVGAPRLQRLRENQRIQAFLTGAGAAAIGAIAGSTVSLAAALTEAWQWAVLAAAGVYLLILRRSVVTALLASAVLGVIAALAGGPISR